MKRFFFSSFAMLLFYSSFPVIHKVDRIGIFLQLLMANIKVVKNHLGDS